MIHIFKDKVKTIFHHFVRLWQGLITACLNLTHSQILLFLEYSYFLLDMWKVARSSDDSKVNEIVQVGENVTFLSILTFVIFIVLNNKL